MANDLTHNPWVLDTAAVLHATNVFWIKKVQFIGAVAGDNCIFENGAGQEVFHLKVPTAGATPTRGRVSWVEVEVPFVATRARVSQVEVEVPAAATRGRVSWVEIQVPSPGEAGGAPYRHRRREE